MSCPCSCFVFLSFNSTLCHHGCLGCEKACATQGSITSFSPGEDKSARTDKVKASDGLWKNLTKEILSTTTSRGRPAADRMCWLWWSPLKKTAFIQTSASFDFPCFLRLGCQDIGYLCIWSSVGFVWSCVASHTVLVLHWPALNLI